MPLHSVAAVAATYAHSARGMLANGGAVGEAAANCSDEFFACSISCFYFFACSISFLVLKLGNSEAPPKIAPVSNVYNQLERSSSSVTLGTETSMLCPT